MIASRRGFLRGALSLLAAPAVIKISALMPISTSVVGTSELLGPQRILTIADITREAIRLWHRNNAYLLRLREEPVPFGTGLVRGPVYSLYPRQTQRVEISSDLRERTLSLKDFSKKHLAGPCSQLGLPSNAIVGFDKTTEDLLRRGCSEAYSERYTRAVSVYDIREDAVRTAIDFLVDEDGPRDI